jgi:hypothetical protein
MLFMAVLNPFLFHRGLSFPRSVQTSLTKNCLKLATWIPWHPPSCFSCGDIGFFEKSTRPSIGLGIRTQSVSFYLFILWPSLCNTRKISWVLPFFWLSFFDILLLIQNMFKFSEKAEHARKIDKKMVMSILMLFYFRSEKSQRHACTV